MTSRQAGQKISQMYSNRTGYRTGKRKTSAPLSGVEKRRLAQFLVCGTVFVLLVAVKLLLPARVQWLSQHVGGALERSVDVTEVFSAVGRMFAGDKDGGWEDLYQSVFHPEDAAAVPTGAIDNAAEPTTGNLVICSFLKDSDGWLTAPPMQDMPESKTATEASPAEEKTESESEPQSETGSAQKLSYILYSNRTLPENVSMEQKVLGFDYCTPVMGTISSDFGYREHPIEGDEKFHYGLDIAADEGTDIDCFADGTVTTVGESSSYGKYAIVAHSGGFSTLYAHCCRITVSSGSAVKEGQKIGEVGQTGEATGPHLHFEIHFGDTYLDPIYYVSLS
ncbi:putative metalloendopeptidase [Oscillibacter valericigenes Sjm18-20]|nr:putative metalloendopeptidase [Oscillibacter valericigenes Sjm18-20]